MLEPPEYAPVSSEEGGPKSGGGLLLVGSRRHVRDLARTWANRPWSRIPILGVVGSSSRGRQLVVHPRSQPVPILGRLERLQELVSRSGATDLVVAVEDSRAPRLRSEIERLSQSGSQVRVHWVGDPSHSLPAAPTLGSGSSSIGLGQPRASTAPWNLRIHRAAKRGFDLLAAGLGILILSPLLSAVALIILVSSGRPIFYSQERVGQGGRRFRIFKFRSMRNDAEDSTGPIWAENKDQRCTRFGAWLRHTNIDELPQLFNVLNGDMSLVGPRPERPCFVEQFQAEMSDYELRHAVPCGMTGWAQVHGWRGRTSLRKRLQYDLDYIGRWTFALDLRILLMTVEHVVYGRTQWNEKSPKAEAGAQPAQAAIANAGK